MTSTDPGPSATTGAGDPPVHAQSHAELERLYQRVDLHMDRPTPARMYDYFLDGKDNFAVDREAADVVIGLLGE